MPVPFPSPTFPANYTPYPLKAFVPASGLNRSPAWAFRSGPATPPIVFFDMTALILRSATVASNDQKTSMTVNATGGPYTFNLAGDGTAEIPVGILS